MSILFSLPVHENNDAIRDTIANARLYNPGSTFVLHVSASFGDFDASIAEKADTLVNPIRFPTVHSQTSHVPIHLTNFKHAVEKGAAFDRVCVLHTSEMFVKPGLYDHIKRYEYSIWFDEITQPREPKWPPFWVSYSNGIFKDLFDPRDQRHYLGNVIEGHWWSRDLFQRIHDWSEREYGIMNMLWPYAAEECFFPTIANHFAKGKPVYHPYCCFHHKTTYVDNTKDIDDIRQNKPDIVFWQPNNFVYHGWSFPGRHLYSIKRINRDPGDPIRRYINSLPVQA